MAFDTSIANILKFSHSLKNFENAHKALVNVYFGKLDLQVGKQQEVSIESILFKSFSN